MKIFVDVGAYDGDSYRDFMMNKNIPGKPKDYKCYLIEPNPKFYDDLVDLMNSNSNIVEVNTNAVWTEDGVKEFAVDQTETPMGSTLMPGKKAIWDTMPHYEVRTINFSEWIKQFKDDYVIVKLDVEGAEFPILKKMLEDGTIKIIDHLWVEMHPNKVQEYTTEDSNELLARVREETTVVEWH